MSKVKINLVTPSNLAIKYVTWDEVRNDVYSVNPTIAKIIDEIDPGKNLPLIEAHYPYGVDIHQSGVTYIPTNNSMLATLDDASINKQIRDSLNYSICPLGLIMDKCVEVYVEAHDRSIPFKLFKPGTTFGVWEIMDFAKIQMRKPWHWNISSGARTIFMLPSISERSSFQKLKNKYKIKNYMPTSIFDQYNIFKEIVNNQKNNWTCKILFFSKEWLDNKNSHFINNLISYWKSEAWNQSLYWINNISIYNSWENFKKELERRRLRPKEYILDTFTHLVSIGCGTVPGFKVLNDDSIAPKKLIKKAYVEDYQLKYYIPTMMYPDFLSIDKDSNYVYYSLQYPTLPEKPTSLTGYSSALAILRELKVTIDIFTDLANSWPRKAHNGSLDFLDHITLNYFHSEEDKYNQTDRLDRLFEEDQSFKKEEEKYVGRLQPSNAHFFKGCIRVGFQK